MLELGNCVRTLGLAALTLCLAHPLLAQDKISAVDSPPVDRGIVGPPMNTMDQAPNQVNGLFSDPTCEACGTGVQSIAENFIVNTGGGSFQIDQIIIWGGYFPGNTPNATDDFTINFRADAAGAPGAIFSSVSGIEADSRADTGADLFGVDEYMFTFDLAAPQNLANGTYWIEIFNNTATTAGVDFFWETGNLDATNGILNATFSTAIPAVTWNASANDFALQLNGVETPVELQSFSID